MTTTDWLDAWDDCFNFFKGKSPYHTTRQTPLSFFTRNQKVAWKLMCALFIFIFSIFFESLCLSWEGFTSAGIEKTPPLMLLGPMSALFSVISLWVAAVHLYQPTFNGPRILLHYRRPAPCSWEMLDWVFFEASTTATVVSFVYFWMVTLPYSDIALPGLHATGIVVQFVIVGVDFYFTAPLFKANHVFLVLLWPCFWLFVQYLWVVGGHQPSNHLFNFHTPAALWSALILFVVSIMVFFALLWFSKRLQQLSDEAARNAVDRGVEESDSDESSSCLTPTSGHDNDSAAPFELVVESSAGSRFNQPAFDPSEMEKPEAQPERRRLERELKVTRASERGGETHVADYP